MRDLTLNGRYIADDLPPYVIAELGSNHSGLTSTAQHMVRTFAACGVDACKLQKRDIETLYSPAMLAQPYHNDQSFGQTYGAHRKALELDEAGIRACQQTAREAQATLFSTAFDEPSVDLLMRCDVPALKLASGSLTDRPLLTYAAGMGVPLILSTGGGTESDIDAAVQWITAKTSALALLHCTAAYPVYDYRELNLRAIITLRARYPDLVIGWSGHDSGIAMALIAYAFGARIIEKHVTLNRAAKGTDHAFSLEPVGVRKLVRDLARAHEALGDGVKRVYASEFGPIDKMRRTSIQGRWQIGTLAERLTRTSV